MSLIEPLLTVRSADRPDLKAIEIVVPGTSLLSEPILIWPLADASCSLPVNVQSTLTFAGFLSVGWAAACAAGAAGSSRCWSPAPVDSSLPPHPASRPTPISAHTPYPSLPDMRTSSPTLEHMAC